MKKILILCRRDDREDYDTRRSMLRGLSHTEGAEYIGADYEDLLFRYDGKTLNVIDTVSGRDIADHDAIFLIGWFKTKSLDDIARAVAHYAKNHGVPCANSEAYYGRSFTKLSQCVIAALNNVHVTPFLFSLDQNVLLSAAQSGELGMPYIAKAIAASRGNNNYLVSSEQQLQDILAEQSDPQKYYILQSFVPNDGDYRSLVGGGKVRLVMHRLAQGETHVNNTSQGGKAQLVDISTLPDNVIQESIHMASLLNRELTGVDMIMHRDTKEYFFLEANNMPQLSTGSFVPEKMTMLSEYLTDLANSQNEH